MYLVVYQTNNKGGTLNRVLKYNPLYNIGYVNHLGWIVIGVYYFYDCKFIDYNRYIDKLLKKRLLRKNKKSKLKRILDILKESK